MSEPSDQKVGKKLSKKSKRHSAGVALGGAMVGLEQAVFRNLPPAEEVVRHSRPDDAVPSDDGKFLIGLPIPEPTRD